MSKSKPTILVVEDEEEIRQIIVELLIDDGYFVMQAESSEVGLQVAASQRFDLLLTDVVMPGINGRDFADRMRILYPKIPVIFVTGYAGVATEKPFEEDMELLRKPFDYKVLSNLVKRMLVQS